MTPTRDEGQSDGVPEVHDALTSRDWKEKYLRVLGERDQTRAEANGMGERLAALEQASGFPGLTPSPSAVLSRELARVSAEAKQGICSRCHRQIVDFRPPDGGMTAGYYTAEGWPRYANPLEAIICDDCMWRDARYIADYGSRLAPATPTIRPLYVAPASGEQRADVTDIPTPEYQKNGAFQKKLKVKEKDLAWLRMLANDAEGHPRYRAAAARILAALRARQGETK